MPESSLGGTFGGWARGASGIYQRVGGGSGGPGGSGVSGAASAKLNFDITGLGKFKEQIDEVRKSVKKLRDEFGELAKAPKALSAELEAAQKKLDSFNTSLGGGPSGSRATSGMGPYGFVNRIQSMRNPAAFGMTQGQANAGAGGASAAAIGAAVAQGISAVFDRFERGASTTANIDVNLARMAPSVGTSARGMFRRLGATGLPFAGGAQEQSQAMYMLSQQGYVMGATGRPGVNFNAAQQSIQTLQGLNPGMAPTQAAGMVTQAAGNVAAQRGAAGVFGNAAFAFTQGGQLKPLAQRFDEVLKVLQTNRRGQNRGQPFSREELTASQAPGSTMQTWLASLGWDDQLIGQFFNYAIAKSQYGPGFTGTEEQMKKVRGQSLAAEFQETATAQGNKDVRFGGDQYKAMIAQQDMNQRLIDAMSSLEHAFRGAMGLPGMAPSGFGGMLSGAVKGAAMAAPLALIPGVGWAAAAGMIGAGALGGAATGADVGYGIGDTTSQLNPDLRKRVNSMMAANPNLQMVSGYRTAMQQKRLWDSGNSNIAPPGKSRHGRGQAADLGPPSQYGWIQKNARKFGLDHATGMGEPWHVQLSGTLFGDPPSWSEQAQQKQYAFALGRLAASKPDTSTAGSTATAGASAASGSVPGTGGASPGINLGATEGTLTGEDVAKLAYQAGFRGEDLVKFVGIAGRESSFHTGAANDTGLDNSYGLWQINTQAGNLANISRILNELGYQTTGDRDAVKGMLVKPDVNAAVAKYFFDHSGYSPWKPPKKVDPTQNPMWHVDLDAARQYVTNAGVGDIGAPPAMGGNGGNTSMTNAPFVFQNTFHVAVSGSATTDIDNLTRQIAQRLEAQMRRVAVTRR